MARPREMLRAIVRLATSAASGCARPPVPVAGVSPRVLPRNHAPTSTFGIGRRAVVASTARFTRGVVSSYRATGRVLGSARHARARLATTRRRWPPRPSRQSADFRATGSARLRPRRGGGDAARGPSSHEIISTIVARYAAAKPARLDLVARRTPARTRPCVARADAFRIRARGEVSATPRGAARWNAGTTRQRTSALARANQRRDLKTKAVQTERRARAGTRARRGASPFKSNDTASPRNCDQRRRHPYDEFRALSARSAWKSREKMIGPPHDRAGGARARRR